MVAELLLAVAVLLLTAKIFGELAERAGVASLVGELIAGILVGPVLGIVVAGPFLMDFLTVSIIILLFMAGLEVKYEDVKHHTYTAAVLATLGGLLSFFFGFLVGMFFFNDIIIAFAIGTVLISTSNGTLFLFLMKTGEFDSKIGRLIVAVTIADDIVGIIFLSIFSGFIRSSTIAFGDIFQLMLISIGFYFAMFTIGSRVARAGMKIISSFIDQNVLFTIPFAAAFGMAFLTDRIGISIAAGAFLAGMAIANSHYAEHVVSPKVTEAANGFFLPLLYATVGSFLVLTDLNPVLIASLVAAALLGKIVGIGFMSRFFGVAPDHSRLMGIVMIPRGNENIAIVQVIFALGVITFSLYTSIIFAMIATILLTPVLLKLFYKK